MIAIVSPTTLLSHYNHSVLSLKEPEDKMLPAENTIREQIESENWATECRIIFFLKKGKRGKRGRGWGTKVEAEDGCHNVG